jgi:PAS domain-containing protein
MNRKYVDVSDSFCSVLGYSRKELIGERFDEVTAPRTNDIPVVFAFPAKTLVTATAMAVVEATLIEKKVMMRVLKDESWLGPRAFA